MDAYYSGFVVRFPSRVDGIDSNCLPCPHGTSSLLLLIPDVDVFAWGSVALALQCEASGNQKSELIVMEVKQWPAMPWLPDVEKLTALRAFSAEAFSLLGLEALDFGSAPHILLAPLRQELTDTDSGDHRSRRDDAAQRRDNELEPDIRHWAEDVVDWPAVWSVSSLWNARIRLNSGSQCCDTALKNSRGPTLLQIAAEASSLQQSSAKDCNTYLAERFNGGWNVSPLVCTVYNLRAYRVLRAWPDKLVAHENVFPAKQQQSALKSAPTDQMDCSLTDFYYSKYGIRISDLGQCVLEGADGACVRAYRCPGPWCAPRLSSLLCYDSSEVPGKVNQILSKVHDSRDHRHMETSSVDTNTDDVCRQESSSLGAHLCATWPMDIGPVKLVPELLLLHPMPLAVLSHLPLLPLLLLKFQRLRKLSDLRRKILRILNVDGWPRTNPGCVSPFQSASYNDSRHALLAESGIIKRLHSEAIMGFTFLSSFNMHQPASVPAFSNAEIEWILAVATTTGGAREPYDLSRLAWIGDAVLLLIAVSRLLIESYGADFNSLKLVVGRLISNKHLITIAGRPPLELQSVVEVAPFSCRGANSLTAALMASVVRDCHGGPSAAQSGAKKVLADTFEAVLGSVFIFCGLVGSFNFLATLPWWSPEEKKCLSLETDLPAIGVSTCYEDDRIKVSWLGYSAARFHASVWLLDRYPNLGKDGLSERRKLVLESSSRGAPQEHIQSLVQLGRTLTPSAQKTETSNDLLLQAVSRVCDALDQQPHEEIFSLSVGVACLAAADLCDVWAILERVWIFFGAEEQQNGPDMCIA